MGRVLGDGGQVESPARRHARHLARRQGAEHRRAAAVRRDHHRPRHPRLRHRPQLRRRLRRRGGPGGRHRPGRRDGQPADVRPVGVGRRHHQEAARPALLREGRHAAARPGDAGPVRARVDLEAVHDRGRADQRLLLRHPAQLLLVVPGRQPRLQELRVRRLRLHQLRQGPRGLLQHLLLPRRLRLLAALRLRRGRRRRQGPAGEQGQGVRLRQRDRHRHPGRGVRPDRGPEVEARLLRVAEGLLLRHRGRAAERPEQQGDQRLRLQVRQRVLRRGLRLPGRRRRQLRHRPGRHHRHPPPARPCLRGDRQRRDALRAARSPRPWSRPTAP